ncbi:unnamed protein product, partial [Mesorhabditis spiculigera]
MYDRLKLLVFVVFLCTGVYPYPLHNADDPDKTNVAPPLPPQPHHNDETVGTSNNDHGNLIAPSDAVSPQQPTVNNDDSSPATDREGQQHEAAETTIRTPGGRNQDRARNDGAANGTKPELNDVLFRCVCVLAVVAVYLMLRGVNWRDECCSQGMKIRLRPLILISILYIQLTRSPTRAVEHGDDEAVPDEAFGAPPDRISPERTLPKDGLRSSTADEESPEDSPPVNAATEPQKPVIAPPDVVHPGGDDSKESRRTARSTPDPERPEAVVATDEPFELWEWLRGLWEALLSCLSSSPDVMPTEAPPEDPSSFTRILNTIKTSAPFWQCISAVLFCLSLFLFYKNDTTNRELRAIKAEGASAIELRRVRVGSNVPDPDEGLPLTNESST